MADTPSTIISPRFLFSTIDALDFPSLYIPLVVLPDTTPPVTDSVPIVPPGTLTTQDEAIELVFSDPTNEIVFIFIGCKLPGIYDVVWDNQEFGAHYTTSTREVLMSGSIRFMIRRDGGWPVAPFFRTRAVDEAGNVL